MADPEKSPRPQTGAAETPQTLTVPPHGDGMRLDQCLTAFLGGHSRAYFQKRILEGDVRLRGRRAKPSETVHAGDEVTVRHPEQRAEELQAQPVEFDVLYEDDDILVIDKPPGLVVHPAAGTHDGTLVHGLLFLDEESFAEMTDDTLRPGIVHRLDKDTSGVMVVARNLEARRLLKEAFKERTVEKTYLAVVLGEFGAVTGTIEHPIGRHPRNRQKMAVLAEGGKPARTAYRVLGTACGCSLLEVRIFTGRTHQIRVHFSHMHHPILGDGLYGGNRPGVPYRPPRQLLHAWKLAFPHPRTRVTREYMAPLPADFAEALAALGLPAIASPRPEPPPAPPLPLMEDLEP